MVVIELDIPLSLYFLNVFENYRPQRCVKSLCETFKQHSATLEQSLLKFLGKSFLLKL